MKHFRNCEFSFSGLKSAVKREFLKIKQERPITPQDIANLSCDFQNTVALHLLDRLNRAVQWCKVFLRIDDNINSRTVSFEFFSLNLKID